MVSWRIGIDRVSLHALQQHHGNGITPSTPSRRVSCQW
jgi:hypothetical protein